MIEIGAKEFMCVGATPPFDHPHVFCDMGDDNEFICSVLLDALSLQSALHADEARPPECAWVPTRPELPREHAWPVPAPSSSPEQASAG